MARRLLVTGGAGFIGSNFVHYWHQNYSDKIVVLDALTYAGNRQNLASLQQNSPEDSRFIFVEGDICDRTLVTRLLTAHNLDTIVHFAAESHVDRSILDPSIFIKTNVLGTFTLLEALRQHWEAHQQPQDYRFLHISTDEVYGSLSATDSAFTETTAYAPSSPYSASKAGSDQLVRSYHRTYGLPTLITNCGNNYGPYQFPEKLIPLMCINILLGKPLPIYGDGKNIRDWLYVEDHCSAIDVVLHKAPPGETYNIGGQTELSNLDIVEQLCDLMSELTSLENLALSPRQLIRFVKDRPGHDRRYAMDISKIKHDLGWTPVHDFTTGLAQTVTWYLSHRDWWEPLLSKEYETYYQDLYGSR